VLPTDLEGMISDFVTDAITLSNGPELRETVAALRRAVLAYGQACAAQEREKTKELRALVEDALAMHIPTRSPIRARLIAAIRATPPTPAEGRG